jgi:DNA-binding CsgD family transcriptional regulator
VVASFASLGDAPASAGHWQAALRAQSAPSLNSLPLSPRELLVAKLFADDHSAEEIALALGLSPETVRAYLVHVRLKYKNAGRDASTKLRLRALLIADRLLSE